MWVKGPQANFFLLIDIGSSQSRLHLNWRYSNAVHWCFCIVASNVKRIPHKICAWLFICVICVIFIMIIIPCFVSTLDLFALILQALYSLSGRTFCRKISWSLEATRFMFRLFQIFWNFTGSSAAEMSVKFQGDTIIITPDLAASRLHEILR